MSALILTVNAGSSSVRLAAFQAAGGAVTRVAHAHHASAGLDPRRTLRAFRDQHGLAEVDAVSHRVVHGGPSLAAPRVLDDAARAEIRRMAPLAPLHNPVALQWIAACREVLPRAAQVGVFDTAFYAALPEVAATYALPRALVAKHDVRRYGFHGIAHQAMNRRWRELRPDAPAQARVISLQLGAGCSITAVAAGRAVDTSMGFSPLEGLVMATRSGDLDPGLALYLQRAEGLSPEAMERLLYDQSGLLGLSGETGDLRTLLASREPGARLAVEVYCYRARKYVGAFLAALGGAEAILFGGGAGEHAPEVRRRILEGLERLGIVLDRAANEAAVGAEALVSAPSSAVEVRVVPVDEERILAEEALAFLAQPQATIPR